MGHFKQIKNSINPTKTSNKAVTCRVNHASSFLSNWLPNGVWDFKVKAYDGLGPSVGEKAIGAR